MIEKMLRLDSVSEGGAVRGLSVGPGLIIAIAIPIIIRTIRSRTVVRVGISKLSVSFASSFDSYFFASSLYTSGKACCYQCDTDESQFTRAKYGRKTARAACDKGLFQKNYHRKQCANYDLEGHPHKDITNRSLDYGLPRVSRPPSRWKIEDSVKAFSNGRHLVPPKAFNSTMTESFSQAKVECIWSAHHAPPKYV